MAPHQITNNGSIILLQLDNELSSAAAPGTAYPPVEYFQFLEDQFREVGLTVPTFHNDVSHDGKWSNTPVPDIYAYDFYPLCECHHHQDGLFSFAASPRGFFLDGDVVLINFATACGALKPSLPQNDWEKHLNYAPQVPHFVAEVRIFISARRRSTQNGRLTTSCSTLVGSTINLAVLAITILMRARFSLNLASPVYTTRTCTLCP